MNTSQLISTWFTRFKSCWDKVVLLYVGINNILGNILAVEQAKLDLKYIFDYIRNYGIAAVLFYSGIYTIKHESLNLFLSDHHFRVAIGVLISAIAVIISILNLIQLSLIVLKTYKLPILIHFIVFAIIFIMSGEQFVVLATKELGKDKAAQQETTHNITHY